MLRLPAVEGVEVETVGPLLARPHVAADIAARSGVLDPDDVGAQVSEVQGAERSGAELLDGDDPHSMQRPLAHDQDGRRSLPAAVLDLPGVIDNVPGDPSRRIADRPTLFRSLNFAGPPNRLKDGAASCREVFLPNADLSSVGVLGLGDVVNYLVPVAAAAARTLP